MITGKTKGFKDLRNRILAAPAEVRPECVQATRKQAAGLLRAAIKITPPASGGVTGKAAQRQGEGAIKRDLNGGKAAGRDFRGVFFVMSDALIAQAKPYHSSGNVRLFIKQGGSSTVYGCDRVFYRPNASIQEMRAHHKEYFKNGRMSQAGGRTRDVGRWKFIDQMVVSRSAMDRYLKYIYGHVGMLGGGFNDAAAALRVTLPAWMKRHAGPGGGFFEISTRTDFAVVIRNTAPFAQADTQRRMSAARQYWQNGLERQLDAILKKQSARIAAR